MGTAIMVALAATAMALPSLPINPRLFGSAPVSDLRFVNAHIGMTLAQWKAALPPGGLTSRAGADCGTALSSAVTKAVAGAPPAARGVTVCDYETHYGKVSLTQSLPINSKYLALDPRYTFVKGRLTEIEFHAPIDAFNAVVAAIEGAYGPATDTVRDMSPRYDGVQRPRVRKIWRLQPGVIQVVDPSSRADELAVKLSAWGAGRASHVQSPARSASASPSADARGARA